MSGIYHLHWTNEGEAVCKHARRDGRSSRVFGPSRTRVGLYLCMLVVAGLTVGPANAQDHGTMMRSIIGTAPARPTPVKNACLDQQVAINYAAWMMGYHVFGPGGERISAEKDNALAQEIISRAAVTEWSFGGWEGGSDQGRCTMAFSMTLAPQDAAHFNNDPAWSGGVIVQLAWDNGEWHVVSFEDTGAKSAVSGWLAAWKAERERQPGGAPQLASAPSPRELEMKIDAARSCGSSWEVSDDLFPAYNSWLDTLAKPALLKFKVGTGARLQAGRLVSANDQEIVCRYNISTGDFSGSIERSIRDLDLRFTVAGGRSKWEVASFPYAPASTFTSAQINELMSHIYVDGKQLNAGGGEGSQPNRGPNTEPLTTPLGAQP